MLDDGQSAGLNRRSYDPNTTVQIPCFDRDTLEQGPYLRAGFAEGSETGLSNVRKDVFDDRKHKDYPHFDTNHLVTVSGT